MGKEFIRDDWLSEILCKNVYKLENDFSFGIKNYQSELKEISSNNLFIYTKVPVNNIKAVVQLEKDGFNLIDTNVILVLRPSSFNNQITKNHNVRFSNSSDADEVEMIAENSFIYSRMHLDPQIPLALANKVKREWVRSFYHGTRGNAMLVAEIDNKVVGFTQLIIDEEKIIIDLIAVDVAERNKGIAKDMIVFAKNNYSPPTTFEVGTQLANIPSINLYEKLGFIYKEAFYVMHYHS